MKVKGIFLEMNIFSPVFIFFSGELGGECMVCHAAPPPYVSNGKNRK